MRSRPCAAADPGADHARPPRTALCRCRGFTLIEVLLALLICALVMAAVYGVVGRSLQAEDHVRERTALTREAQFAMARMVSAVSRSRQLLLPLPENPTTAWSEAVREPGVLAVTLDPLLDRDGNGWADANNDEDFQDLDGDGTRDPDEPERIDEDLPSDVTHDLAPGIRGIDDDGDGAVDEGVEVEDDDEDGVRDEDAVDGVDDDLDGAFDEDSHRDMNFDGGPGVIGVDDDGDGTVDEGNQGDDDEDGLADEDWLDPVVFHLSGMQLLERLPDLRPTDGRDASDRVIAEGVQRFRVERIPGAGGTVLVDLQLELRGAGGQTVSLDTRVRLGRHR